MVFRTCGAGAALLAAGFLAGCADQSVDLRKDAFVGDWTCGETRVALSSETVTVDGKTRKIAWIETGGNADYGLFTTDGGHYSVFDTQKTALTFHDHSGKTSMACRRA